MGFIKVTSSDVLDFLTKLDTVAPSWAWANEDHIVACTLARMRALQRLVDGYADYVYEIWVIISDPAEAVLARLTFDFVEFGKAVWSDTRKVRNAYQWAGNGYHPVPGYVIDMGV